MDIPPIRDDRARTKSPADFPRLIAEEGAKLRALHEAVHRTFAERDRDAASRQAWQEAGDAFHSYASRLHSYLERACKPRRYTDARILEFVVCFLEVDPWFFRSGYYKENLLTRLKRSDLDPATEDRLRSVVLDAIDRRGARELKYYCRLAAVIADQDLVSALEAASGEEGTRRAFRARRMLGVIYQRQRERAGRFRLRTVQPPDV